MVDFLLPWCQSKKGYSRQLLKADFSKVTSTDSLLENIVRDATESVASWAFLGQCHPRLHGELWAFLCAQYVCACVWLGKGGGAQKEQEKPSGEPHSADSVFSPWATVDAGMCSPPAGRTGPPPMGNFAEDCAC